MERFENFIKDTHSLYEEVFQNKNISSHKDLPDLSAGEAKPGTLPSWCNRDNIVQMGKKVALAGFAPTVFTGAKLKKSDNKMVQTLGQVLSAPLLPGKHLKEYLDKKSPPQKVSTEKPIEDTTLDTDLTEKIDTLFDIAKTIHSQEPIEAFKTLSQLDEETQHKIIEITLSFPKDPIRERVLDILLVYPDIMHITPDHADFPKLLKSLQNTSPEARNLIYTYIEETNPSQKQFFDILCLYPDIMHITPDHGNFPQLLENLQRFPAAQNLIYAYIGKINPAHVNSIKDALINLEIEQFLTANFPQDPIEAVKTLSQLDPASQNKIIEVTLAKDPTRGRFFDILYAYPNILNITPDHERFPNLIEELQKTPPEVQNLVYAYIEETNPSQVHILKMEQFLQSKEITATSPSWVSQENRALIDTFIEDTQSKGIDRSALFTTKALLNTKILTPKQQTLLQEYQKKALNEFLEKKEGLSLEHLNDQEEEILDLLQDTLPEKLLTSFETSHPFLETSRLLDHILSFSGPFNAQEQALFTEFLKSIDNINLILYDYEELHPLFEQFSENFSTYYSPLDICTIFPTFSEDVRNALIDFTPPNDSPFLEFIQNSPTFFTTPLSQEHFDLFYDLDISTQNKIIDLYEGDERGVQFENAQIEHFLNRLLSEDVPLSAYSSQEIAVFEKFLDKVGKSEEYDHTLTSQVAAVLNNPKLFDEKTIASLRAHHTANMEGFLQSLENSPPLGSPEGNYHLLNNPDILTIDQQHDLQNQQKDFLRDLLEKMGPNTRHEDYPIEQLQKFRYLIGSINDLEKIADEFPQLKHLLTIEKALTSFAGFPSRNYRELNADEKALFKEFLSNTGSLEPYRDDAVQELTQTFILEEFTGNNLLSMGDYFRTLEKPVQEYIEDTLQKNSLQENHTFLRVFLNFDGFSSKNYNELNTDEKALFRKFLSNTGSLEHYKGDEAAQGLIRTFILKEFTGNTLFTTGDYFRALEKPVQEYIENTLQNNGLQENSDFLKALSEEVPNTLSGEEDLFRFLELNPGIASDQYPFTSELEKTRTLGLIEKMLEKKESYPKSMQNTLQNLQNGFLEDFARTLSSQYAYDTLRDEEKNQLEILLRSATNKELFETTPLSQVLAVHHVHKELTSGNNESLAWFLDNIQDARAYKELNTVFTTFLQKELNAFEENPKGRFLEDFFSYSIGKKTALLSSLMHISPEESQKERIKETLNFIQENVLDEKSKEDFDKLTQIMQPEERIIARILTEEAPIETKETSEETIKSDTQEIIREIKEGDK